MTTHYGKHRRTVPAIGDLDLPPVDVPRIVTDTLAAASGVDAELVRRRYDGLKPFAPAPPPPAVKPITLSASDPTVFSHVPITDKVAFVTIDDGLEKEPGFIEIAQGIRG